MSVLSKAKFWTGLWAGRFFIWYFGLTGQRKDDRPGYLARRIDPTFMKDVAKAKYVVAVCGTNGKTGITSILASMYDLAGRKWASNNWGANDFSGEAWALLDSVNIFNKPTKEVTIVEGDEIDTKLVYPEMQPNYVIITNIARDSIFRNAYPEYVRDHMESGINSIKNVTLMLNGDDPISFDISPEKKRVYYGVCDMGYPQNTYGINEFTICPKCGSEPEYIYRNYRHIGRFKCPKCGYGSPEIDYLVTEVRDNDIIIKEKEGSFSYPRIGEEVHNVYNTAAIVAYMRTVGFRPEEISDLLSKVELPKNRMMKETVNGVEVLCETIKSQNSTATSVMYEAISREEGEKEIVMVMDEEFSKEEGPLCEVGTYIYDIDYEFLNDEHIKKIILAGDRCLDHKIRAMMAGIPEEKMVVTRKNLDAVQYVDVEGIDKIYVLRNYFKQTNGTKVYEEVLKKVAQGGKR